jgi:hypothetical protein
MFIESVIKSVGRLQRERERVRVVRQANKNHLRVVGESHARERVENGLLQHMLRAMVVVHGVDNIVLRKQSTA